MKIRPSIFFLFVLFAGMSVSHAGAQQPTTIQGLNDYIARLEAEIKRNEQFMSKVSDQKKVTDQELRLIGSRIANRQELVKSYDQQIKLLEQDISGKNRTIRDLDRKNTALRKEYGEMVYAAYKNYKLNNSMAFIFASKDFSDMTRRMDYIRRYNKMRENTAAEIDSLSGRHTVELMELNTRKQQLDRSRESSAKELSSLKKDEATFKKKSTELSKEQSKLAQTIKKNEAEKKQAQAQLKKIMEEEARKNAARNLTEAEQLAMSRLSAEFEKNRGKLPWPVTGGAVVDKFGTHVHPTQKNLKIENNGVNIAGEKGAPVKCVFNGEVTQVVFIKGMNNCVIVCHGDYYTVYANLSTVKVSRGDKLSTAQQIGTIPSTGDANDRFLHFEIFRDRKYYDPQLWLFH